MTSSDKSALAGSEARKLVRTARKAALATLREDNSGPFVSLVTVATDSTGAPLTLISSLAWHTKNVRADNRVSLLVDGSGEDGDPLEGMRVSLWGVLVRDENPASRERFLAHHPAASFYAGFKDFAIYRLEVEGGHSVAGFGRIETFAAADYLLPVERFADVFDAASGIIQHMNEDHADAVALYAERLMKVAGNEWRMTSCDPDGFDIVSGNRALRFAFDRTVATRAEVRQDLVEMVRRARAME